MKEFRYKNTPVLETTSGKLKGFYYDGIYTFRGIPYAEAKRFHQPMPSHWEGVKDATSYGFVCPLLQQDTPSAELLVPHRYWPMDENCQNLNIWTDSLDESAKKPVIVWIHGGGYFAGSSIEQIAYDGYSLASTGEAVIVSINHRLNILGYLDLSPFGEEYANSANAGHADMVAALRWIHDNIARFGGDPDNVTLFGQSGGGMKILDLMQIPEADGLFHKALIMSGVADENLMPEPKGDGRMIVTAMLKKLGIISEGTDASETGTEDDLGQEGGITRAAVKKLETIPYVQLAAAYNSVCQTVAEQGGYTGTSPMPNDWFKGNPLLHGFRAHAYTIPVMIGTVFAEFTSFAQLPYDRETLTEEQKQQIVRSVYGDSSGKIIDLFRKAFPEKNYADVVLIDRCMREPSKKIAAMHAAGKGAGTYLYEFTVDFPEMGKAAWHCSDIPFFFRNTALTEYCQFQGAGKLERAMSDSLISLAKTGAPASAALPAWPSVTPEKEPTMIFDKTCEVRENFDDELFKGINEVLPPFSLRHAADDTQIQH